MFLALRVVRTHHPPLVSLPLPISSGQQTLISFRFRQAESVSAQPENQDNMDKTHEHHAKTQDVMSDSFGEGYSTRSDEEGFGGIYGENQQQLSKPNKEPNKEKVVHENHPEYDKSQGSEVSEREKGRHQTNIA